MRLGDFPPSKSGLHLQSCVQQLETSIYDGPELPEAGKISIALRAGDPLASVRKMVQDLILKMQVQI